MSLEVTTAEMVHEEAMLATHVEWLIVAFLGGHFVPLHG